MNKAESSRINGAKSRGPVTPEGKKRSSLNSVRHGLLARFACLTNEGDEYFLKTLDDFVTRFQPADGVELRCVEQLASCAFRLERFLSTEAALFDHEMDENAKQIAKEYKKMDHATEFALAFKSLADNSKALPLYLRYMAAIGRQYDRALKQFLDIRAKVHFRLRPPNYQTNLPSPRFRANSTPKESAPWAPPAPTRTFTEKLPDPGRTDLLVCVLSGENAAKIPPNFTPGTDVRLHPEPEVCLSRAHHLRLHQTRPHQNLVQAPRPLPIERH